jgi:predicted DNA binding CopG/RHH family protein
MKKPTLATRPFDDEERDLMATFDQGLADGTLVSHLTPERQVELRQAATLTMNPPRKQISTRLPERDLVRLKAKALEQGVPYQSLLASIVHLYVEGALVEKDR